MVSQQLHFRKEERLCHKKAIEELFREGLSLFVFPLKVTCLFSGNDAEPRAKVMFVVPKKKFKLAVDRNRIRRVLKEAYRSEKHGLIQHLELSHQSCMLAFVYVASAEVEFIKIKAVMHQLLLSLAENKGDVAALNNIKNDRNRMQT